jgi:hypothetical protein
VLLLLLTAATMLLHISFILCISCVNALICLTQSNLRLKPPRRNAQLVNPTLLVLNLLLLLLQLLLLLLHALLQRTDCRSSLCLLLPLPADAQVLLGAQLH